MRDYNYRKLQRNKEQEKLSLAYHSYSYNPRGPEKRKDPNGLVYFIQGHPDNRKPWAKKMATKKVRRNKLIKISNGKEYRKHFPLNCMWF